MAAREKPAVPMPPANVASAPGVTFRREKTMALGFLALLAPIPLGFSFTLDWAVLFIYSGALAAFLLASARGRILTLSNAVTNVAAVAFLALFYADLRTGSRGLLKSALHLLLFVTLMKLASVRRDRDFSWVLGLVGFLFLTSVATSFHYATALYIVAFLFAAWPILVKWALWRDLAAVPEEWLRDPAAVALPGLKSTIASVLAAGALSAPIFFILPRLKAPYVKGVGGESQEVTTGISDTVNPDVFGTLKQSEQVYMRITADGSLLSPTGEPVKIRAIAFSRYEGRAWQKPAAPGTTLSGRPGAFQPLVREERVQLGLRRLMAIDLSPLGNRYLPYPLDAAAVRVSEQTLRQLNVFYADIDDVRNVRLPLEPERPIHYDVAFGGPPVVDFREPRERDSTRSALDSERIRAFTLQQLQGIDPAIEPERAARRIEAALSSRLGFEYSVVLPRSGPNPVEEFLFERKTGHCETFATAMALMLREVGVPTRFVTGFVGGEVGLFGQYLIVRGQNAHSWVEVWCGRSQGWQSFDPTPAGGRPTLLRVPLAKRLSQIKDGVEFFYDRYILSFGQADQEELIKQLRELSGTFLDKLQVSLRDLKSALRGLTVGTRLLLGALVAGAAALIVFGLLAFGRATGRVRRGRALPPASRAYRALQRSLRRHGAKLTPASAPGETLRAAEALGEAVRGPSREIVRAYVAESFGGQHGEPREAERLKELQRRVAAAIRSVPRAA